MKFYYYKETNDEGFELKHWFTAFAVAKKHLRQAQKDSENADAHNTVLRANNEGNAVFDVPMNYHEYLGVSTFSKIYTLEFAPNKKGILQMLKRL
jgi:hypothetical protein